MFKKGQPVRIPFCNKEGVVEYESQIGNSYLVGVILLKAKGITIAPTLKWYQVKDLEITTELHAKALLSFTTTEINDD